MAVSIGMGLFFVSVLTKSALLFEVYTRAPDFGKLPDGSTNCRQGQVHELREMRSQNAELKEQNKIIYKKAIWIR